MAASGRYGPSRVILPSRRRHIDKFLALPEHGAVGINCFIAARAQIIQREVDNFRDNADV